MTHAEHVSKPSRKKIVRLTVRHVVLALLAAFWLIPILWLVLNAFSVDKGPNLSHFFPQAFTLNHFKNIRKVLKLGTYLKFKIAKLIHGGICNRILKFKIFNCFIP